MSTTTMTRWAWVGAALFALVGGTGCETEAFCFQDCPGSKDEPASGNASASGAGGAGGFVAQGGAGGGELVVSSASGGGCEPSGNEVCDGIDNDCNGKVDDVPDFDPTDPKTCGTCDNNCFSLLANCSPDGVECKPAENGGAGECVCNGCATDYFDLDKDGKSCEYYCVKGANDDTVCNNKDDDCDGLKDEDVDLCTSTTDCGKCGGKCSFLHATAECVNDGNKPCDPSNTKCALKECVCNGPGDCWHNLDNSDATGCEYLCFPDPKTGGVEVCGDGIDNDCDGKIDDADDLSGDPQIGKPCFGDPDGECATPAHQGKYACKGGKYVCDGPNVITENQQPEVCNNKDDDCDGKVDEDAVDVGMACGKSNIFPCQKGKIECQNGAPVCVGNIDPGVETCNGVDDDCDGVIDKTGNAPPSDAVGDCDVPPPPPAGATSPCKKGTKACVGGVVVCQGSKGPTSPTDACGEDSNCDGVLQDDVDLKTDVHNCGACGNDCAANSVHGIWACKNGACEFQGCETGYYDLDNDKKCEYACVFVQPQETCNGVDDNCNGQVDENVVAPSPSQVCGVQPGVVAPECTSSVKVTCDKGAWKCTFPQNVCNPTCATAMEVCDALDNNCNGALNENVANFGKACASDDGLPPPGHGACKTVGTFVCNGPSATKCSAVKGDCAQNPGGCTEACDGVDNDCDGLIDEPYTNKGANPANFVKPVVTKISSTRWIFTYEASRPNATSSASGTGNGYHTMAPAGETLDKTPACSVPGKIPWFNVTPAEVEQTCTAMGGFICSTADWQTSCRVSPTETCVWGYSPRGAACDTTYNAQKYCNLGPSFDFNPLAQGDQDGLLPTASNLLKNCAADWSNLLGNTNATKSLFDVTGNLREITKKAANQYALMGGAFNTQEPTGATCDFTFYTVDSTYKFFDTGFRCCFSSDPSM